MKEDTKNGGSGPDFYDSTVLSERVSGINSLISLNRSRRTRWTQSSFIRDPWEKWDSDTPARRGFFWRRLFFWSWRSCAWCRDRSFRTRWQKMRDRKRGL